MNLFVVSDFFHSQEEKRDISLYLDKINDLVPLTKVIVVNENGAYFPTTSWAYDKKIEMAIYNSVKAPSNFFKENISLEYLKKIVEDYNVDAFAFFTFEDRFEGNHKDNVRRAFDLLKNEYKDKKFFINE